MKIPEKLTLVAAARCAACWLFARKINLQTVDTMSLPNESCEAVC
jgi:hypothetical protein